MRLLFDYVLKFSSLYAFICNILVSFVLISNLLKNKFFSVLFTFSHNAINFARKKYCILHYNWQIKWYRASPNSIAMGTLRFALLKPTIKNICNFNLTPNRIWHDDVTGYIFSEGRTKLNFSKSFCIKFWILQHISQC